MPHHLENMFKLSASNDPNLCCQSTNTPGRDSLRGLQPDWSIEALHNTCFNQNFIGGNHFTTSAYINRSIPPVGPAQYPELDLQPHSSPNPANLLYHPFSTHLFPDEVPFHSQSDILPSTDAQAWSTERGKAGPNNRQLPLTDAISAPQLAHYETNESSNASEEITINRFLSPIPRPSGRSFSADVNQPDHNGIYRCFWQGCTYPHGFTRDLSLWRHIKTKHLRPKSIECPLRACDRRFDRADSLLAHQRVTGHFHEHL